MGSLKEVDGCVLREVKRKEHFIVIHVFLCLGFRNVFVLCVYPFYFFTILLSGLVFNLKPSFIWILRHQCLKAKCQATDELVQPITH